MNTIPVCPTNNVIVVIDKKFKDVIATQSGLELYQDTTYRPEWHVTITGKVVSVPNKVDGFGWDSRSRIDTIVEVGDEIVFSYLVVFDMAHTDDRDEVFYEDPIGNPYLTQYSNKADRKLVVQYRPEDDKFNCAEFDAKGNIYEIKEGLTELQRDNFLGGYKFSDTNQIGYNNLLELAGNEYWMVDYGHIMAARRGNMMIPIGGNVILDMPIQKEASVETKIILLNPLKAQQSEHQAEAMVLAIGDPVKGEPRIEAASGEKVVFDERYAERYNMWGKDVLVLKQKRLLAKL